MARQLWIEGFRYSGLRGAGFCGAVTRLVLAGTDGETWWPVLFPVFFLVTKNSLK